MALFDDFLITSDYDGTLTDLNGVIPQRNLEALHYFMENGGAFTINTGRSGPAARELMAQVPANAPFLLMNGAAAVANGQYVTTHPIDLDPWAVIHRLLETFPELELEMQDLHYHHLINPSERKIAYYDDLGWSYKLVQPGDDLGLFLKMIVLLPEQQVGNTTVSNLQLLHQIQAHLQDTWGDRFVYFRLTDQFMSVHAKGVSKLAAARQLQKQLGKKHLVCIGDELNDIPMLDGADYAFCPADGRVAERYKTVCNCGDGAVADVIYKKIPQILGILP